MTFFGLFFIPYVTFLLGGAYSIQQTLEGLKISSSNYLVKDSTGNIVNNYWSPSEAVLAPFGMLAAYAILLLIILLAAGYVLGRWRGILLMLLVVALPGIASTLGFWPSLRFSPDVFIISGTGSLGDAMGIIPLLVLGLLTGWGVVVVLTGLFKLNERYRSYYDHLWYSMAILAGVFYVSDSGSFRETQNLQDENRISQQASLYLLRQVRDYMAHCEAENISQSVSCKWSSSVQQILNDYANQNEIIFSIFGPDTSLDIYNPNTTNLTEQDAYHVRKELEKYNEESCPIEVLSEVISRQSPASALCQSPPANFCRSFPDPMNGQIEKRSMGLSVAIANECIVPTLVMSKKYQEKMNESLNQSAQNKHYRWLFFILASIIAGGKIANATSKATGLGALPNKIGR